MNDTEGTLIKNPYEYNYALQGKSIKTKKLYEQILNAIEIKPLTGASDGDLIQSNSVDCKSVLFTFTFTLPAIFSGNRGNDLQDNNAHQTISIKGSATGSGGTLFETFKNVYNTQVNSNKQFQNLVRHYTGGKDNDFYLKYVSHRTYEDIQKDQNVTAWTILTQCITETHKQRYTDKRAKADTLDNYLINDRKTLFELLLQEPSNLIRISGGGEWKDVEQTELSFCKDYSQSYYGCPSASEDCKFKDVQVGNKEVEQWDSTISPVEQFIEYIFGKIVTILD